MGSEAGVGWNWAAQAAMHGHEVHVITRSNNRDVIEEEQRSRRIPRLFFHYYDLPSPFPSWKKRTGYYGLLTYYYFWQLGVWGLARRLHRVHGFDLAHHVTFVNDWMPSGVGWIQTPFIWGPVGGSTNVLPASMRESHPSPRQAVRVDPAHDAENASFGRSVRGADPQARRSDPDLHERGSSGHPGQSSEQGEARRSRGHPIR